MFTQLGRPCELVALVKASIHLERLVAGVPKTFNDLYAILLSLIGDLEKADLRETIHSSAGKEITQAFALLSACQSIAARYGEFASLAAVPWEALIDSKETTLREVWDVWFSGLEPPVHPQELVEFIASQVDEYTPELEKEYYKEIGALLFFVPRASNPDPASWDPVSRQFTDDEFAALPRLAREDFLEAGHCFLVRQFASGSMMAMRAVEATLRECVHRVTKQKPREEATWKEMVQALEGSRYPPDSALLADLETARRMRNSFAHPDLYRSERRTDWNEARTAFGEAKRATDAITRYLRNNRLSLSVSLGSMGIEDLDVLVAAWILDRKGPGVGYYEWRRDLSKPATREFDEELGIDRERETVWTLTVTKKYRVDVSPTVLQFCATWLEKWREKKSKPDYVEGELVTDDNFEVLIRTFVMLHDDPEQQFVAAFGLLDEIERRGFQFNDLDWAGRHRKYRKYLQIMRIEQEYLKRKIVGASPSGSQALVSKVPKAYTEMYSRRALAEGDSLIGLTDEESYFAIWSETDTSKLFKELHARIGGDGVVKFRKQDRYNVLEPIESIALPIADLKEIFYQTDRYDFPPL